MNFASLLSVSLFASVFVSAVVAASSDDDEGVATTASYPIQVSSFLQTCTTAASERIREVNSHIASQAWQALMPVRRRFQRIDHWLHDPALRPMARLYLANHVSLVPEFLYVTLYVASSLYSPHSMPLSNILLMALGYFGALTFPLAPLIVPHPVFLLLFAVPGIFVKLTRWISAIQPADLNRLAVLQAAAFELAYAGLGAFVYALL